MEASQGTMTGGCGRQSMESHHGIKDIGVEDRNKSTMTVGTARDLVVSQALDLRQMDKDRVRDNDRHGGVDVVSDQNDSVIVKGDWARDVFGELGQGVSDVDLIFVPLENKHHCGRGPGGHVKMGQETHITVGKGDTTD